MKSNKELILIIARDIYLKDGLASLSMRKVASKVGISATAIYRHYTNKEELLFHVLLKGYRVFEGYLNDVDESQNSQRCLFKTTEAYLIFALNEQAYYRTLFMSGEETVDIRKKFPQHADTITAGFQILQRRVALDLDDKNKSKKNAYTISFSVWAYAHGQISLFLQNRTGLSQQDFTSLYVKNMNVFLSHI